MMGARYIGRVAALMPGDLDPRFKDLPAGARTALLVMAGMALDYDGKTIPAGHYFGGWHRLANCLGYPNANTSTPGHRAVARAVRELRQRGLVHQVGRTEKHRSTATVVYALDL